MTRINCIPPNLLLDEHLQASVREGLRPINEVLSGKDNIQDCPDDWKLGTGHVKFCKAHLPFTRDQWVLAKDEYHRRGFNGFTYDCPTINQLPAKHLKEYIVSEKALRSNLARIIERWRKRKSPYHFRGMVLDSNRDFLKYYKVLKSSTLGGFGIKEVSNEMRSN